MVKEELYIGGYVVELLGSLNPNLTFNIADVSSHVEGGPNGQNYATPESARVQHVRQRKPQY